MFRNSKNSSVYSSETNGSLGAPPPPPPAPPRGSSASVAMSELSASGLIEFSDHSADHRCNNNNHTETNDSLKKRVSRVSEEGESNNDEEGTEKSANKKQDSALGKMWNELQCCLENDENDELNPFSKRRMVFVFLITVLAIVVNLIVIPIALTNMDKRRVNKQQALNQTKLPATDVPSIQPSISASPTEIPSLAPSQEPTLSSKPSSLPSQMPSMSPTKEGETRPPSVKPTEAPTESPTQLPSNTPTIPIATTSPTQRPIAAPIPSQAVAIALPSYTIQALDNTNSPQYKAFQWLTSDPNLNTYTTFRQYQRMALATFFFATNSDYDSPSQSAGNAMMDPVIAANLFADNKQNNNNGNIPTTWYSASNWLSYTIHECFWFSQASFVCDTQQRVRNIQLQDNGLVGTLPPELAMLTLLQSIDVSRNARLFGSIPTQLGDLTQLSLLNLSQLPQLSGTIPYQLANLHNSLVSLHLYETPYLFKSISTQLGRLTKLQELLLDTRYFEGQSVTTRTATLPTELASMRALQQFRITGMELQGTLPSELAQLSQLEELYVGRSNINGAIPDSYGTFLSLTSLELISNQLSSTLPSSLSLLGGSLEKLKVNSNQLTGTVPSEYSSLTNCKTMSFQNNDLSGTVPQGVCDLRADDRIIFLEVDCSVGGSIECSCDCICF